MVIVPVLSRTMRSSRCVASSTSPPLMTMPSWGGGLWTRSARAQRVVDGRPGAMTTSTSSMRPAVIVPVLSRTTQSSRCVASSTSPPLMTMPSWAPRPVPTMIAVGVARPSAHGHAMISTAIAAVKASAAAWPVTSHPTGGEQRDQDHHRHEHARHAVGEPLHRRLGRLRLLDEPRDLGERGVAPDAGGPDDEPARRVDGRAEHLGAGGDLDRDGLSRQHRHVDCARPVDDDAVGRDLLARPDDEPVADDEARDRDLVTVLEPGASSRPGRGARASPVRCGLSRALPR